MGITYIKTNIDNIVYNGTEIEKVIYNGTTVWTKAPKVWGYSRYTEFVGVYGTTHFLFRADTSNVVHMVNISTFEEDGQFLFGYHSSNEFMAYGNGVYCCNQYGDDYLTDSMNAWIVRYHNGTAILLNNPLREKMANTIEQHFRTMENLDFDTLWGDLYGINYNENKLVLKLRAVYCTNEQSGDDEWTNDYDDDFIVEVPIENGALNYEKATIVKHFYSRYTLNEPSSYEDYSLNYYYNPNTKDFYSVFYHEDNDGDYNYASNDTEWGGYTAEYMYGHNIIYNALFSLSDVDATISISNYFTSDNNFTIYVFNKKKIVKNVLTDENFFGKSNNSPSQITIKYNGQDIYIINKTKKLIRKLTFNKDTLEITL